MLIYKNILRAVDNTGINSAFGFKYYLKGNLTDYEFYAFLRTQVASQEYLKQVANFSPFMRKKIQDMKKTETFRDLEKMYEISCNTYLSSAFYPYSNHQHIQHD